MSMNKKGQSALEFLMTYGWAILVVLAAIGALAYFGVLNPSNFLPDQCTASTGFGCVGKPVVNATSVMFILTNGVGGEVLFDTSTMGLTTSSSPCNETNIELCNRDGTSCGASKTVGDGQEFRIVINCLTTGNVHKSVMTFNYNNSLSSLPDQMIIQISGKKK